MQKFTDGGSRNNWWVVAVGMYACLIFSGSTFFAFSLFVKPLQTAFEWERSAIMVAFGVYFLMCLLAVPIMMAVKPVAQSGRAKT